MVLTRLLRTAVAGLAGCLSFSGAACAQADGATIERLRARADIWLFTQKNDPDDSHTWKSTLRLQQPFRLPDDWRVILRGDLPVLRTNKKGTANPDAVYETHVDDTLLQIAFTTPPLLPDLTLGFGARMVFPTGGPSPFGKSQYQFAPQFGFAWKIIPELAEGLTFEPQARYFRGFSPTRSGITTVRQWDLYPTLTLALPEGWSVSLWNENPLIHDNRTNAWFVPLDGMVWKDLGASVQLGLGAAVRLVNEYKQYKYMVYGRTSVFF